MKDEIKEILEGIKVVIKHDGTLEFDTKELKILLDYITNLQEENKELKIKINKAMGYIYNLIYNNKITDNILNILQGSDE